MSAIAASGMIGREARSQSIKKSLAVIFRDVLVVENEAGVAIERDATAAPVLTADHDAAAVDDHAFGVGVGNMLKALVKIEPALLQIFCTGNRGAVIGTQNDANIVDLLRLLDQCLDQRFKRPLRGLFVGIDVGNLEQQLFFCRIDEVQHGLGVDFPLVVRRENRLHFYAAAVERLCFVNARWPPRRLKFDGFHDRNRHIDKHVVRNCFFAPAIVLGEFQIGQNMVAEARRQGLVLDDYVPFPISVLLLDLDGIVQIRGQDIWLA